MKKLLISIILLAFISCSVRDDAVLADVPDVYEHIVNVNSNTKSVGFCAEVTSGNYEVVIKILSDGGNGDMYQWSTLSCVLSEGTLSMIKRVDFGDIEIDYSLADSQTGVIHLFNFKNSELVNSSVMEVFFVVWKN